MRRFLSRWLVWVVILVFAAMLLFTYPSLTSLTESSAEKDLSVLLDAAFTRLSHMRANEEAVSAASNGNILAKARAIDRFVAHDDTLTQTDALVVLSGLLSLSTIDITDAAGEITASSAPSHIGRNVLTDAKTEWATEVAQGEGVEKTHIDEDNHALLTGCVPRTDTDGLVLVQALDIPIMNAEAAATPAQVLLDMSFIRDTIEIAESPGEDLTYYADGNLYVRRTENDVTFVASRSLAQVHMLRSAVMLCEAVGMFICVVFSAIVQLLLLKRRRATSRVRMDAQALAALREASGDEAALEGAYDALPEGEYTGEDGEPPLLAQADESESDAGASERRKIRSHKRLFGLIEVIEEHEPAPQAVGDAAETELAPQADEAVEAEETAPEPEAPGKRRGLGWLMFNRRTARDEEAFEDATSACADEQDTLDEGAAEPEADGAPVHYGAEDPVDEALAEAEAAQKTLLAEDADDALPKRAGRKRKAAREMAQEAEAAFLEPTPAEIGEPELPKRTRTCRDEDDAGRADADGEDAGRPALLHEPTLPRREAHEDAQDEAEPAAQEDDRATPRKRKRRTRQAGAPDGDESRFDEIF